MDNRHVINTADRKRNWWIWRHPQTLLNNFAYGLMPYRGWSVVLSPKGTGYCNFHTKVIQANPQLFPAFPVEEQYECTQGILAHEVGHVRHTDAWVENRFAHAWRWLTNSLEDERMERATIVAFPAVAKPIHKVGYHIYHQDRDGGSELGDADIALSYCLLWRWASRFSDEDDMFSKLAPTSHAVAMWQRVRPLVEQSWEAPKTAVVIDIAAQILATLGIEADVQIPEWLRMLAPGGVPISRGNAGEALPSPDEVADTVVGVSKLDEKGLPKATDGPDDIFTHPCSYLEVEAKARSIVRYLVENLIQPEPIHDFEAHECQGRFRFRQYIRTPERPYINEFKSEETEGRAMFVLVDRSGSMSHVENAVQTCLMGVYLGATDTAVRQPIGIGYFGANADRGQRTFLVTPVSTEPSEVAQSYIAGFEGSTGSEFLYWGLGMAEEELQARKEKEKVIVVIHDGQPVYNGVDGCDWDLSHKKVRDLIRDGYIVIGMYLGADAEEIEQLSQLFPTLITCTVTSFAASLVQVIKNIHTRTQ